MIDLTSPTGKGFIAAKSGTPRGANPYREPNSYEWFEWDYGWTLAGVYW
jgi:hypothetical protein